MKDKSVEELRAISMEKNKRGCATAKALRAQKELYDRAFPFHDIDEWSLPVGLDDTDEY